MFLGQKKVTLAHLASWKEYLEYIKFQENYDWLKVLKVALSIYNGDTKGFARVPDEHNARKTMLKIYMKDLIKDSVQTVIFKFRK